MNSKIVSALRPWLVLALVCGGFSLHPDFLHTFWTRDYLPTIAQQAATNVILAVGLTFVILTGGIDLSVGSVLALCGVALGLSLKGGVPPFLALLMALPLGVLVAYLCFASCRARPQRSQNSAGFKRRMSARFLLCFWVIFSRVR